MTRTTITPTPTMLLPVRWAWTEWLSSFAWDHALTLTSQFFVSRRKIAAEFTDGMLRQLARVVHRPIPFFWVVEQTMHGSPHVHALVSGTASLNVEEIEARWPLGFSRTRMVRYDARLGAAHYLTKSLSAPDQDDYQLSRRLPPRCKPLPDAELSAVTQTISINR